MTEIQVTGREWNFGAMDDAAVESLLLEVWAGTLGGASLNEAAVKTFATELADELERRGHHVGLDFEGHNLFIDNTFERSNA